ncbi:putative ribonuclease H-like domain-containing protein [Tanacetum coccineum]
MRTRRFFQKTGRKITINRSDTAGYDKSKVKCFNCHKMGYFARECRGPRNQDSRNRNQDISRQTVNVEETSSKAMVAIDGVGFDWSYMENDEVPTNIALMAFSDFELNKSEFNLATYKRGLASVEEQLVFYKKNELEKLKQEKGSNQLKIEKYDNASKSLDKLIGSQITDKSRKSMGFVSYNVVPPPPPPTGLFSPLNLDLSYSGLEEFQQPKFESYGPKTSKSVSEDISNEVRESPNAPLVKELVSDDKLEKKTAFPTVANIEFADCNYHQRERVVSGNNYTKVNYNYSTKQAHPSAHKNIVPREVLMKTSLRPLNTARPVTTAHPKTTVYSARPMPKVVNTVGLNSAVVNAGHPQKEDQGYVDSGCSRHMTRNMSYLSDFKEFDGGYVTFGGGAKGGKITGKGTLKIGKLDFEDVYFVKELQFTWVFFLATKEETSGILKRFITKIENLVDKKVKIIRCDNETEFKNSVMSEFCEKKGIKKEFSVARTPQQNGVAERRNRTLIEAARTMLADSKLPTTFWAEAVNIGRTPALSFMRPFGCHVTILNTLNYLAKFNRKSDEGFFVGYSMNSKAFRVYNIRTRKVEENLHIRFLEDKPIIAGDGPKWLFDIDVLTKSMNYVPVVAGTNSNDLVGTEESIGAGHSSKETGSSQDYILMPLWKDGSLFDSSSKNASNDEPQPSSDAGKKDDEGVNKESGIDDQERPKNSTQDINTAGPSINTASTNVNTGSLNINIVSPTVTTAPLEATHVDFFGDETEVGMSNITTTYPVPSTLNTRINKDQSLDHVISDVQFGVQTRRMIKTINEQGFISFVFKGKNHKDLHTCLFACFLSQEEPKKVWTLVDLPHGKRSIGTKQVYRNKKYERVARIEAIRMFLAYASFKDLVVYQMDVKSIFLYGKIEEEVYVCQPLGFEDQEFPERVYKVEKALYGLHQAPRACNLISWKYKKQTIVANSTTKSEYVAAASCCGQVLWIQNQMLDYGYNFMNTKIFIDNDITICIVKNPVFHSKTKHIEIRRHFIRDYNEKKLIQMIKIHTDQNVTDLLIKAFDVERELVRIKIDDGNAFWNEIGVNAGDSVNAARHTLTTASIQALVDGKKVIVTETSVRRALQLKDAEEPMADETENVESVPTHSNDPLLNGAEITKLKNRVKMLERRNKSRTLRLKRLRKVGRSTQVVSSKDEGLGAQEDTSKQGKKITDLDADAEEVEVENVTLIEIKAAKPKAVTIAATTTTTAVTRPKARGVVVQEPTMIDADYELAARLQVHEKEELTVEEKSKLFKDEGSVTRAEESSSKRAGTELEQERIKKQKIDDDQEEAEMKKHMEIVVDEEEIAVDAIPLATKPPIIIDWKIIKEGKMGYFQLIRADGSLRRYSSMIKILQNIDRETLKHSRSWLKLNMGIQGQRRHMKECYEVI